jgi:hypothetical protein
MGNCYRAVFAAVLLFFGICLAAQEPVPANGENVDDGPPVFPIHRLWLGAEKNALRWRPDWPFDMPPDSFDPVTKGRARRVTVTVIAADEPNDTDGAESRIGEGRVNEAEVGIAGESAKPSLEEPVPTAEYTVRLSPDDRLVEFPFLLDGVFYQASARYDRRGIIETMTLGFSSGEPVEIAFLQTDEGRPVTARIKAGESYYFASFRWLAGTCIEMWTDANGVPLQVLHDERIPHYDYDSMRNITAINDGTSEVSAQYTDKGVRYWTTATGVFSFQRDETGLVVRLTGVQKTGNENGGEAGETGEMPVNYSYEYTFDRNGNWTERREIRWSELNGYLVPSPGTVASRLIEY